MRTWVMIGIVMTAVAAHGCSSGNAVPSARPAPAVAVVAPAPVATENGSVNNTQLLDKAITAVKALDLSPSDTAYREFRIADPSYVFVCAYSPGGNSDEVPLLACHFGEFVNSVAGHALFWKSGGEWKGSYYPQPSDQAVKSRQAYFNSLGENCPIGCGAGFKVLRQERNRLLAVVDLSSVGTHSTQEVQLLERDVNRDEWRLLWVTDPDTYRFLGRPEVILPEKGISQFTVTYEDGDQLTWRLQGTAFGRSMGPCKTVAAGGIVDQTQAPFSGATFVGGNRWQGFMADGEIIAFAGRSGQDEAQGLLIVEHRKNGCYLRTDTYPTPGKGGVVRIVAAEGNELTMKAENGQTWIFDVARGEYRP